jgi:hypothetical protein
MDRTGWPVAGGIQGSPDPVDLVAGEEAPERGRKGSAQHAEKSRLSPGRRSPYRTPTLVGWGSSLQVDERSFVKELGKLAP